MTLNDFPGRVACVVYVIGCNYRCPFCYNAALVKPNRRPAGAMTMKEVISFLHRRQGLLDGVVVSGGEPTLWPGLGDFLAEVKGLGFETMVETNGSHPEVVAAVWKAANLDFCAVDYKTQLADYDRLTGFAGAAQAVRKTLRFLGQAKLPFVVRTTLVPGLHTSDRVRKMAEELRRIMVTADCSVDEVDWSFQRFRPKRCLEPAYRRKKELSRTAGERLVAAAVRVFPKAVLRL